ncbi:MAG: hypothetical protein GF405_01390 [Candidatus Eisenbacteria bacterium]|nr:hypothetical protein [Candidatus Eisenbacteria bacterium]
MGSHRRGRRIGRLSARIVTSLLLTALVVASAAGNASALEGALSGYIGPGTYTITGDISVPAGQTLTLAPGVVFEFEDGFWEEYEFDIEGALLAEGSDILPISFRAVSGVPEYNYIRIRSSDTVMRHCIIEDVGKVTALNEGGLWVDNCSPLIEDCEIVSASWHGVYVTGSSALPTIRRTVSHDNGNDGFDADSGAGLHLEHCVSYGNGEDGICLASGSNTLVGCLVYGNGEDGIDCHGVTDYDAAVVNCTVGPHPGEGLSDDSAYRLYNTLVVDSNDGVAVAEHSLVVDDLSFFGFVDPASGDFRLTAGSPAVNYGTRFGAAGTMLPGNDLDGNARVQGIVDAGAYESSHAVDPETGGTWFSENLLRPRMGQPVFREDGESFTALVGLMGSYSAGSVAAQLVDPEGGTHPLNVVDLTAADLTPGSGLAMKLYRPGLETVQQVSLLIPVGTPDDVYRFEVTVGGYTYFSRSAVRVYDTYPISYGVLHITDTHIGYDQETYTATERLQFFVQEANFLDPELVILTGDVCENQNLGHDWPQQYLAAVADLRVPIYVVPGNHDHYNDGADYNPAGRLRYFHEINRFRNSRLDIGSARFYGLNSQFNYGLADFYRCHGPSDAALDWVEADAGMLAPSESPRFLLMHGPNYDYFSWNMTNTGRVRDIMELCDFDLGPAGHTHRFETFLNSGENSFGRNDFEHEDDWGRDVPFPGYPLHVQTSSLGKEEHLSYEAARELEGMETDAASAAAREMGFSSVGEAVTELARAAAASRSGKRGLFGDDIGWRWIQIDGAEVGFFTADTDGDGYRNTEDPWLLGEIRFDLVTNPDGSIVSSVENRHYETWTDVRHHVPADPSTDYLVSGGTLLRRLPDGTAVVAVSSVGPLATSVVTLEPTTGVASGSHVAFGLRSVRPNPFNPRTTIRFVLPEAGTATLSIYSVDGGRVATLADGHLQAGSHRVLWEAKDDDGNPVSSGVYFARLSFEGREARARMTVLK